MEEDKENGDIIKKSYMVIYDNIDTSVLLENEKKALKVLIEKLVAYYDKKMQSLTKRNFLGSKDDKIIILKCTMTDILVDINNVIKGGLDVYYFVSIVNKKINDKELEKAIKIKKI